MLKPTVRRSACDQCRAKRVRCLRAENSTAPCARCSHIGARCVTGAPGHPGRPSKPRLVNRGSTPRDLAAISADVSSPGPAHRTSTVQDMDYADVHAPSITEEPLPATAAERASPCRADSNMSWDQLCGVAVSDLVEAKSGVHPYSPGCPLAQKTQPDFWGMTGDRSAFFGPPSIERSTAFDMGLDLLLQPWESTLPPSLPQSLSPASSLMRFREEMDQRIAAVDTYFLDPPKVVEGCKEESPDMEAEHPAALLLTCCKEFMDIIRSLKPAGQMHMHGDYDLSTEIVLLVLSSYLALMRLFDSLFYTMYQFICQMPPDSFKSVKVKSVLRIGGISSLQDMPIKTYAISILDAIQGQVRTLERYMGIPIEYCLSGEVAASTTAAPPGIFTAADRAQLFEAVMAQEDLKSRQGSKTYVESIRVSIHGSMRFLDD